MGKEKAQRIQTSLLNAAEKRALVWLAERQPAWVTSDMLTWIGVAGAAICGAGFALSGLSINYLWLSSLGLLINWYGDSLDGTLARVRHTQRPKYGFFIDHTIDALTIALMCVGAGLSPLLRMDVALVVLAAYLVLSVYTYICAIVKDEFRLTYGRLGPTEFRLIIIIVNTLLIYTSWSQISYTLWGITFGIFDICGVVIAVVILGLQTSQWLKDRKRLSEADPLRKPVAEESEKVKKVS
ncbi:MAG: CDP-alcohol phosphatidyltransferase family protein [Tidjanibacter sp.]|nr:CDP-alcohol phosphatidyltransferase family protein [Tidjanibacter sp.]